MTTFTTYNVNDIVFIENIGYGTLMDYNKSKSASIKEIPLVIQRRQSIYFDPQLFDSESQSLIKQKSQSAVLVPNPKLQSKKAEQQKTQQPSLVIQKSETNQIKISQSKIKEQPKINIVKIKLEGTNALIYTSEQNMRKFVVIPVRPMFLPALGTINIKIQIGKTIQSLKRQIFQLLGLKHAHYFNVKIFTTSPTLSQLNCTTKTIWQYGIRQTSTLSMTAEHGFCFQPILPQFIEYFNLLNNNLTLVSLPKKPKVVVNIVLALPPAEQAQKPIQRQSPTKKNYNSEQAFTQQKQQTNNKNLSQQSQVKKENCIQQNTSKQNQEEIKSQKNIINQIKQIEPPQIYCIHGDRRISSGKQYFQVRLDKLPQNPAHLKIGISTQNNQNFLYFSPLTLQKIIEQQNEIKLTQNYGMSFKQNDVVGVLTRIDKYKNMKVNFFKNNINLGLCFQTKINQISFVFTIGSEGQISLDTRAQYPVDSYRFR